MNNDTIKGTLQKIGGRIEESAGVLVNDPALKNAGKEDQLKGKAREAWGNVKDAAETSSTAPAPRNTTPKRNLRRLRPSNATTK
ncbi:CsbD family protein [Granulicella aggregans]|uniref:CsbD family protein n=1 Tax=Granulicella aggregans TaxID=474949 RepID=UPI0021E02379|nr:CsbD family protein [Granulicella aggregans]